MKDLLKQYKQQLEDFLVILERMKTNNLGADDILWAELGIQKTIKNRRTNVTEVLENNGIQSMEQYQKLMGELDALFYVQEELSGLLEKQEQLDD